MALNSLLKNRILISVFKHKYTIVFDKFSFIIIEKETCVYFYTRSILLWYYILLTILL